MSMNGKPFRGIAITTTILSYLSGSTIVGIFSGRWLDSYFGTSPWFLLVGLLIGLAARCLWDDLPRQSINGGQSS